MTDSFKYPNFALMICFFISHFIHAQGPLGEIEGRLSIYVPQDSTSLYIGKAAGESYTPIADQQNTFVGYSAGAENEATGGFPPYNRGTLNSFYGAQSGASNTKGSDNCFFGTRSGFSNSVGYQNSFFGTRSGENTKGQFVTSGNTSYAASNSFFGYEAGSKNESGRQNSFFGARAGRANLGIIDDGDLVNLDSGSKNSYFGYGAGASNEYGELNVFVGFEAGHLSGSNNVILGNNAGRISRGSRNIIIGNEAGPLAGASINDRLYIDVNTTSDPLIYGEFDNDILRINGTLEVESNTVNLRHLGHDDSGLGYFWSETNTPSFGIVFDGSGVTTENRLHLREYVDGGPETLMTFKASGEIGVGTESPDAPLHVGLHMKLEPITVAPSCGDSNDEGRLYYNLTSHKLKVCTAEVIVNRPTTYKWVDLH